jgi:molybdopterin-guanine dinucleotide biosynthesis protein A
MKTGKAKTFMAIYRGGTVASAELITVTADPIIIGELAERMLESGIDDVEDPVVIELENGRMGALRAIIREALVAKVAKRLRGKQEKKK